MLSEKTIFENLADICIFLTYFRPAKPILTVIYSKRGWLKDK